MGIISRFKEIMEANINALLDKCEDPEKMIDQTLRDLRENYADVKKETAGVMADEKAAERRLKDAQDDVAKYEAAARKAVLAGNEDDARKLLTKASQVSSTIPALNEVYNLAHSNADKMRQMTSKLQADIETLETRKDAIKAKVQVAKAQQTVNKAMSGTRNSEASISAFERMEAKADKMLDQAEAEAELTANASTADPLLDKYSGGECDPDIEAKLAALKVEVGK